MKYLKLYEDIEWEFDEEEIPSESNLRNDFYWEFNVKHNGYREKMKKPLKNIKNSHLMNIIRHINRYKYSRYNKDYLELLNIFKDELKYRKRHNITIEKGY